jgi:hypothetical protein
MNFISGRISIVMTKSHYLQVSASFMIKITFRIRPIMRNIKARYWID